MSNIYQDQARDFANIPILRRDVIACVHLEDKDDIVFWDAGDFLSGLTVTCVI